ncbi:MAG: WYL domain-containing protein, partial [Acidimicrobiales bacterium]|nr:WYL domain-containing protein [Acidimicrobiales bacterium]
RAFERDKDDLREMGVPLRVETVPGTDPPQTGYRIPRDEYYLRDPGLEPDELAALHLAASTVGLDGDHGLGGLWKLGGALGGDGGGGEVEPLGRLPADAAVAVAFQAVAERRPLTFRYRGEARTVDPYRLDFQLGRWYLTGFDHLRGEERNFRFDRIEGELAAGRPRAFERPQGAVPGVERASWQLGEGEPVVADLLVDADHAALARHELGEAAVTEERADGSVRFSVGVTNRAGFRAVVLGHLDHAEILGPPELRDDLVAWLRALVAP